jgi:hypothetical protein
LLKQDAVTIDQLITGDELTATLSEFSERSGNADSVKELLQAAFTDSQTYHDTWMKKPAKKK